MLFLFCFVSKVVLNVLFLKSCFVVVFRLCIVLVVFFVAVVVVVVVVVSWVFFFLFVVVGLLLLLLFWGIVYGGGGGRETCFGSVFKSKIHLFLHPYSAGPCPDSPLRHSPLSDHHTQHLQRHQQVTIVRLGLVTADYLPTGIAL